MPAFLPPPQHLIDNENVISLVFGRNSENSLWEDLTLNLEAVHCQVLLVWRQVRYFSGHIITPHLCWVSLCSKARLHLR